MKSLIKTRGFAPLCGMIYLNAFIDLGHKIIIQNTIFKIYDGSQQIILTAIVNALILLPFILLFSPAGKLSDRYAKTRVLRIASVCALLITAAIGICYWQGWFWPAFALTFVLAIQSACYGPAKYGLLKELISNQQLSRGNGIAQAMGTIGILSGILCFSILFESRFVLVTQLEESHIVSTMAPLAWVLIGISICECLMAWRLPMLATTPSNEQITSRAHLQSLLHSPILFPAIIGLCVFWSVGQMLLATYPAFAKAEIGITNTIVIQGLLATIGIGIMLGSIIGGRLSRGHIELALIPAAGIGICLTAVLLPFITNIVIAALLFFSIGVVGGFLVVPLNAIVQYCSHPDKLGLTIANSNLLQNSAMFSCLMMTLCAAFFDISAKNLLLFVAVMAIAGIGLVLKKMPYSFLRLKHPAGKALKVEGFNLLAGFGKVTFVLNTWSEKHRQLLQMAYPRRITWIHDVTDMDIGAEVIAIPATECDNPGITNRQVYRVNIEETSDNWMVRFTVE